MELILKIYKYFGAESKRNAPFYAWNKVIDRTVQALDISRSFLNKILKEEPVELNARSFLSTRAFLFPFIFAYLKPSSCKVFQSLYFDNFKEWFFSKVTRNFLIETYSFFEIKDIALFTWTKLGLIPTIQHPISGHHLTLQMPEKFPLIKDKDS
jgi:hypothetical protein